MPIYVRQYNFQFQVFFFFLTRLFKNVVSSLFIKMYFHRTRHRILPNLRAFKMQGTKMAVYTVYILFTSTFMCLFNRYVIMLHWSYCNKHYWECNSLNKTWPNFGVLMPTYFNSKPMTFERKRWKKASAQIGKKLVKNRFQRRWKTEKKNAI